MTNPSTTEWTPIPKVTTAAVIGAVVTIIAWIVQVVGHVDLPMVVMSAIQLVVMSLTAYFKK